METPINHLPEMSEKSDIILMNLMKAKNEMGSTVKKDAANPFHKSRYATLGAHLELCEEILFKHGLLMLQCTNFVAGQHVLIATLHHPASGQWIKSYLPLPNPKGDSQGVGASITYMRRYSINSMLGLNAEDDDGETASGRGHYAKKEEAEKKATAKSASPQQGTPHVAAKSMMNTQQINTLTTMESKLDKECKTKLHSWMNSMYKTTNFHEIPEENFSKIYSGFENALKFMQDQQKNNKVQRLEVAHA